MSPRHPQSASARRAVCAALVTALLGLPACSSLTVENGDPPTAGADPAYNKLIADYIKGTFKDHASYEGYEISSTRWVHSLKGWSWLTCVRFQEHARQRTYAVFIKDGTVVDARYPVQTDACSTETYKPFDLMTGSTRPVNPGAQEPIY